MQYHLIDMQGNLESNHGYIRVPGQENRWIKEEILINRKVIYEKNDGNGKNFIQIPVNREPRGLESILAKTIKKNAKLSEFGWLK